MRKDFIRFLLAAILFCTAAYSDTIVLGYVSVDPSGSGLGSIDVNIHNLTGANFDGGPTSVSNQINFTTLDLTVTYYDVEYPLIDTNEYTQSDFTLQPDGDLLGPSVPLSTFAVYLQGTIDNPIFQLGDGETAIATTDNFTVTPDPFAPGGIGLITVDETAAVPNPRRFLWQSRVLPRYGLPFVSGISFYRACF